MESSLRRADGRAPNQLRNVYITYNVFEYAAGSVLFEIGKTKVLCAVTLQTGVPPFLKGKRVGWLNAEYAMLPAATTTRTVRESEQGRKNGRSVEISRLIGRSLRSVIDLSLIGERTIIVDCDVLQADGGTRTACITAAGLALEMAQEMWLEQKIIMAPILRDGIVAVSVGLNQGMPLVDLNFEEDSSIDADFNIVLTKSGNFIEIQGSAEGCAYSYEQLIAVQNTAISAAKNLMMLCEKLCNQEGLAQGQDQVNSAQKSKSTLEEKVPFFSLQNRLNITSKQ